MPEPKYPAMVPSSLIPSSWLNVGSWALSRVMKLYAGLSVLALAAVARARAPVARIPDATVVAATRRTFLLTDISSILSQWSLDNWLSYVSQPRAAHRAIHRGR